MNTKVVAPVITGNNKVFFGKRKADGSHIYISKPEFSCDWYWSFGYLGNTNEHYHLDSYQKKERYVSDENGKILFITENRNICLHDALLSDYDLSDKIKSNLWQFCELSLTIYTLKAAAEVFYRGGSYMTTNVGKEYLKDNELYTKLVCELIPKQCQSLWDLIGGNV